MSADDESSWRLLFSIALSHGHALRSRQLLWEGWMVFLSSAALVGTPTGVYPVLLDQLWQRLSLRSEEAAARRREMGRYDSASSSFNSFNDAFLRSASDALTSGSDSPPPTDAQPNSGFVEFGGFVDMMKVLCVRVFQTSQMANLRQKGSSHGEAFLKALRHCAEDHVLLTEAVRFTASRYLRPFIAKCTIHTASRVSLRASRNGWAPHVNRLVTHVVGALTHDVILPIYRTYADETVGRLTEEGYRLFLRDYLPGLNTVEETCARAIFAHGGFPDVRPLQRAVLDTLASVSPSASALAAVPTIGLTDFMEALLMLAVVVSADEARDAQLRPITAKVWTFFDRFLCSGTHGSAAMCDDPYVTGQYATVAPGLVCVFPSVVPLLPCPSLLVEVCNATVHCSDDTAASAATTTTADAASRLAAPPRQATGEDRTPFLTEVSALEATELTSLCSPKAGVVDARSDVAVDVASPFFTSQWSLLERNADVPLFGDSGAATACRVTVGGTVVSATPASSSSPEAWRLSLATLALESVKLTRCAVEAAPVTQTGGREEGVQLILTPIRTLPVELEMPERETVSQGTGNTRSGPPAPATPWGCKDVVFTDTPVTQVIPPPLVQQLLALLRTVAGHAQSNDDGAIAGVSVAAPSFSVAHLCEVCRRLQWCGGDEKGRPGSVDTLCSEAVHSYRSFQRLLRSFAPQPGSEARPPSSGATAAARQSADAALCVSDVLGCLSLLLFRINPSGLCDIPNVPRRLELALLAASASRSSADGMASATASSAGAAVATRFLPHNRLRDEPFRLALERKGIQSAAAQERRAVLIEALRDHHAKQVSSPVALPLLPETRPNAMRLVSQYGNVDPAADFQRVMMEGAETIKAHFVERELSIPEWKGG